MRSSRRRPEPTAPTFFIDRGLGKHHVPAVFTAAGFSVVLMADAYPEDARGRVTIPRPLRTDLGIEGGTEVAFERSDSLVLRLVQRDVGAASTGSPSGSVAVGR